MRRKLNIAFLMDPLETLDLKGDTTFALALEAQNREHLINFFKPEDLCVTNVSVKNSLSRISIPLTKSPEVIPVAQKIESPFTISCNSYFFVKSFIPILFARTLSSSVSNINLH